MLLQSIRARGFALLIIFALRWITSFQINVSFMKRKISTLVFLLPLLSLLTCRYALAQHQIPGRNPEKHQLEQYRKPANAKLETIKKLAAQKGIHPVSADLTHWKKDGISKSGKSMQPFRRTQVRTLGRLKKDSLSPSLLGKSILAMSRKRLAGNATGKTSGNRSSITARTAAPQEVPERLYVNQLAGEGLNDGTNWENAFLELGEALKTARFSEGVVKEIWVANGLYHPTYDAEYSDTEPEDPRGKAFILPAGVKIYGGFAGDEESVTERNLRISAGFEFTGGNNGYFATILSGDFLDNDYSGEPGAIAENAYHVVVAAGDVGSAVLDGFVVTGGNANGSDAVTINGFPLQRAIGGGLSLIESGPFLSNLLFADNAALLGSAIGGERTSLVLTNSLMVNNYASAAGTVYFFSSSPVITNITITANAAQSNFGGIAFEGEETSAQVRNTISSGNETNGTNVNAYVVSSATVSFAHCILGGSGGSGAWNPDFGTDAGGNLDPFTDSEDPALTVPLFFDESNGYFGLYPGSPAINAGSNAYFAAGQSPDLSALTTDQRGTPRITKGTVDIGALESLYGILQSNLVPDENGTLYVKKGGTGNGSSWLNAAPELSDALLAATLNRNVFNIWVAKGTYLPRHRPDNLSDEDPEDIYNTFLLVDGVSVYGGFAGTETALSERQLNLPENASILSGDFDNNDQFNVGEIFQNGPGEELEENVYRVVSMVGLRNYGAALNGFTIQGGNGVTDDLDEMLFVNESDVPLGYAAGVLIEEAWQMPLLENLIIKNNVSIVGSGLVGLGAAATITNSVVYHNFDVAGIGSGISGLVSPLPMVLINTTVTQNLSLANGPGVGLLGSEILIGNSIIYQNVIEGIESQGLFPAKDFASQGSTGFVMNSIIGGSGGSSNWNVNEDSNSEIEDMQGNLDEDPVFKNIYTADFSLSSCSRAIDAGNINFYEDGTVSSTDLAGNPRVFNNEVDMGALEYQGLQGQGEPELAGNGNESVFEFTGNDPHTFTAEKGICSVDLLTLTPANLTGTVTSKVWFDPQVRSFNDAPYLQRHYDIIPADNPETATAEVTLYFTQAEFNALNEELTPGEYLPTGQTTGESTRISNFRIYQFHGESTDGSGMPWSYEGTRTEINPDDNKIVWNAGLMRWEVTFSVTGFSGFFGGTASQNPLPVRLVSFEGKQNDDQSVKLDWKVVEQQDIAAYEVEYSEKGKIFKTVGKMTANTFSDFDYSYTDSVSHAGDRAYYRLKIAEVNGTTAYSKIIAVKLRPTNGFTAYPIPAKDALWIRWEKSAASQVELIDLNGNVLRKVKKLSASQKVDISNLPAGVFILKSEGYNGLKVVKE